MKESSNLHICQENKIALEEMRIFLRTEIEQTIRNFALNYIDTILNDEILELCGKSGKHKKDEFAHRGGSEKGWVILDGQRTRIKRPHLLQNPVQNCHPFRK